jgi:hypothetical protein
MASQPQQDQSQEPPPSLPDKLALAQQQAERYQKAAASPNLSPQAAAVALNLARSHRAAARLFQNALAYQAQQESPVEQGDDAALAITLGLPLNNSPPDQPNPSTTNPPPPSISPGISGSRTSPT